jgi:hypothetical protein
LSSRAEMERWFLDGEDGFDSRQDEGVIPCVKGKYGIARD